MNKQLVGLLFVQVLLFGRAAVAQDTLSGRTVQLKEVVIRPDAPIRVMKDTVEYRAGAYKVRPHDKLEDLLKQLPGMVVGPDGKVTVMGQPMIKLRVNGKDFFTNNLQDFLNRLPADIIDKLQVIDDYGDQANFTGIKTGKPQKMLNLVIKEGRSNGEFGDVTLQGGTTEQYGGTLNGNLWRDIHQLRVYADRNQTRTEAGKGKNLGTGFNYNTQYGKMQLSMGYQYSNTDQENSSESQVENLSSQGSLFNHLLSSGFTGSNSNALQLGIQSRSNKSFLSVQLRGGLNDGTNQTSTQSRQSGLNRLDQETRSEGHTDRQNGSIGVNYSRNMDKPGRVLNFKFSLNGQQNNQENGIRDMLRYYDQTSGNPLRDSILQRQLDQQNRGYDLATGLSYAEPLNDQQAAVKRNIDLSYDFSARGNVSGQETAVMDPLGQLLWIDSLSSRFYNNLMVHQLSFTYRQNSAKLNLDMGVSVGPGVMKGRIEDGTGNINYTMFNVLPKASLRYTFSPQYNADLYYTGSVRPPEVSQLMPIGDQRNLQNVTVGNPALRPGINHVLTLNLNRLNPTKGQQFSLNLTAAMTKNQVVRNVLLVADTLNSLRQETHYLNANGSYIFNAAYNMSLPFAKIYQFRFSSQVGLNKNVLYMDNQAGASKSVSFNQQMGLMVNTKVMAMNTDIVYNLSSSSYTLGNLAGSGISSMDFRSDVKFTFSTLFKAGLDGSYRINKGYTIPVNNPVLINAFAEWYLTKTKVLSLSLWGYDLLNQQNAVTQLVIANSITQRTMNRIGRYLMLSVKLDISRFGDKKKTVNER